MPGRLLASRWSNPNSRPLIELPCRRLGMSVFALVFSLAIKQLRMQKVELI